MRHLSIFFAIVLAPTTLCAQTSSMQYAPQRPSQGCPVSMAVHRIAGNTIVQTDTPTPTQDEKQMRARVLELKGQIDALKAQKADLQGRLGQESDPATSANLQRQVNEIEAQLKEKELEANLVAANPALEEAKPAANGIYGPGMGLDLDIVPTTRSITAVDVLVHGFSNRPQLAPASQSPSDLDRNRRDSVSVGSPAESFHLTRRGSDASIRASVVAKGMMGISWLEVTRIEFADGSTWQPVGGETCRFAPSLYVPVNLTAN